MDMRKHRINTDFPILLESTIIYEVFLSKKDVDYKDGIRYLPMYFAPLFLEKNPTE